MTWLSNRLFGGFLHELNKCFGELYELVQTVKNTADEIEAQVEVVANGIEETVDKIKYEFDSRK